MDGNKAVFPGGNSYYCQEKGAKGRISCNGRLVDAVGPVDPQFPAGEQAMVLNFKYQIFIC